MIQVLAAVLVLLGMGAIAFGFFFSELNKYMIYISTFAIPSGIFSAFISNAPSFIYTAWAKRCQNHIEAGSRWLQLHRNANVRRLQLRQMGKDPLEKDEVAGWCDGLAAQYYEASKITVPSETTYTMFEDYNKQKADLCVPPLHSASSALGKTGCRKLPATGKARCRIVTTTLTVTVRLGVTQPPNDSSDSGQGEQETCEAISKDECTDTQATQTQANGTEASGHASQAQAAVGAQSTSFADASEDRRQLWGNAEDNTFVAELVLFKHGSSRMMEAEISGGQIWGFFKTQEELDEINCGRDESHGAGADGDICCETKNKLKKKCGRMTDNGGKEWYVICPTINGEQRYQFADVGECL
ncbi:hypothetical protein BaRGS_00012073, partial [Batillaria attramentaria]